MLQILQPTKVLGQDPANIHVQHISIIDYKNRDMGSPEPGISPGNYD